MYVYFLLRKSVLFNIKTKSFPLFQSDDMRIAARVSTKITHCPKRFGVKV